MSQSPILSNEEAANIAFTRQAPAFDELYQSDIIIQYKRKRVRDHVLTFLPPHANILELNAGTGDDAIFFAQAGHTVHATDISDAMQAKLKEKAVQHGVQLRVGNETCSFTELNSLSNRGPYDLVFSNFAGLNCTDKLADVLLSLDPLVKPGGFVTLVILPGFCAWEFLLLFRGKFKTAFRRLTGARGAKARVEGQYFRCWYYSPAFVKRVLKYRFKPVSLEGLCTFVPPSYLLNFAEKYPKVFSNLVKLEERLRFKRPWRNIGDYYIITFQKPIRTGQDESGRAS